MVLAFAFNIPVENPPADDLEGEFALIPDANGRPQRVNVDDAMSQVIPFFNVERGVVFELYTPSNPEEPDILVLNDVISINRSHFDPNMPTRLVIHGWLSRGTLTSQFTDGNFDFFLDFKRNKVTHFFVLIAYFKTDNHQVNCLIVNWGAGADTLNYIAARRRVGQVGQHVAALINFLVDEAGLRLADLVVIGHSLGAHVSGFGITSSIFYHSFESFLTIVVLQPVKM